MRWLLLALFFAGCAPDEATAIRAIKAVGLNHVKLGLYPFFQCANEDYFNSAFTAYTREGNKIKGAVCCGVFKGCTVRFQ